MRIRLLLPVLLLPALALAQQAPASDPTGEVLLKALPPGVDLTIHVPSVPKFLASAPEAGVGSAQAWSDAFTSQLTAWGKDSGEPERLVKGGRALLSMADGEAVLCSLELPRVGTRRGPTVRCVMLAFRTSAKEPELRKAVDDIVAAGLSSRWEGALVTEHAMGRPVLRIASPHDALWIRVEDGLVAASNHPIALGLLFRGLERVQQEKSPKEDVSAIRLHVRYGRADDAARWEGVTFLQTETLSLPEGMKLPAAAHAPADAVMSLIADQGADTPVFPVRLPDDIVAQAERMDARPLALQFQADGTWAVAGTGAAGEKDTRVSGSASRLGWLRALATGALACAVPIDPAVLAAPLASAPQKDAADEALEWRPMQDGMGIRGPAWHGPVTFLALRTLSDIIHGVTPGAAPPPPAAPPPLPGGALPAPK